MVKMFGLSSALRVICIVYLCAYNKVISLPFYGMEDNCILSFVVPKEKVKSSCELDEKVNRRINAMETKVNIYKQQVSDLQIQFDKQKQLDSENMDTVQQRIKDIGVNVEMSFLLERRLAVIEQEFERMRSLISSSEVTGKTKSAMPDDKTLSLLFNTVDNNSATLSSIAKTAIHSEVTEFLDTFTKRLETYVQDQILIYSKVFNLLSKTEEEILPNVRTLYTPMSPLESKMKLDLEELGTKDESVNADKLNLDFQINITENSAEHTTSQLVVSVTDNEFKDTLVNETSGEYVIAADENVNISLNYNNNDIIVDFINDTKEIDSKTLTEYDFSQEKASTVSVIEDVLENNDSFPVNISETDNNMYTDFVTSLENGISNTATSRMNSHSQAVTNYLTSEENETEDEKNWKEDMIRDQFHKNTENEENAKEEMVTFLLKSLAEVMSLIEKQKISTERDIKLQADKCEQMNKDVVTAIKDLDDRVQAITLQMESLSQGFQDSFSKLDTIKSLQMQINEMKQNTVADSTTMSELELEEQSKRLKKLERLVAVYQQSLEHYRNETKHEYGVMKEVLAKDTTAIKTISKTLQNNLTMFLNSEISRQNKTFINKIQEVIDQLRIQDEALILLQLDLANVEKSLNSRASRWSDRDVDKMQEELSQLAAKHGDFRKKLENVEQTQNNITENLNLTMNTLSSLKMELKLDQDEWIPSHFEYDVSKTDCYGEQYVKRTKYSKVRFVGVVLCSPKRYKIFLSPSLSGKFLNIGDGKGMGEDHCEFVGGTNTTEITLSPFKATFGTVEGYVRNHWGEQPVLSGLNNIKPSPQWYECNVDIP